MDLADDKLAVRWSERALFQVVATLVLGAGAVLRRITDLGGTASYDDIQQYFAEHPTNPIPPSRIGGIPNSVKAVQRRIGPDGPGPLPHLDERARCYRIADTLVVGLTNAFALAEACPTCWVAPTGSCVALSAM
ncbi:hypothetical protein OHT68_48640 (plasmid) [Streptomyces canus]|uniref:hypothetical protein n=1 Tax=Streptomyces canus TaxID=58343 RepID=UPI002E2BC544|nr:hypothetical protein [Streptomyces canus]